MFAEKERGRGLEGLEGEEDFEGGDDACAWLRVWGVGSVLGGCGVGVGVVSVQGYELWRGHGWSWGGVGCQGGCGGGLHCLHTR